MPNFLDNELYNLIGRHLAGETTPQEDKKLEEIVANSPEAASKLEELSEVWDSLNYQRSSPELVSESEKNEEIWDKTFGAEQRKKYKKVDIQKIVKVAAVIAIFAIAPYIAFNFVDNGPVKEIQISTIQKETKPGQKSTITLQDGTIVYLNSGSKISYQSNYNDSLRIIELEGQAFFDIFRDEQKPFIVRCRNLEVEALGTSFDVNGYRDAPIQVSLLTGSVRLSVPSKQDQEDIILSPGEFSIVDESDEFIARGTFNPYNVLAWKEGRLMFRNNTLKEITPKLALWFGVTFKVDPEVNLTKPFTATFEKENLDNILLNMESVLDFEYIKEGNTIEITTKTNLPM